MHILDTHLHLIYRDRFSYDWLPRHPKINADFTLETYFGEAEALGITSAIHMEVDVSEKHIEAETDFVLSLGPRIVGAIAACRPEHADFAQQLERLAAKPGVVGFRRILHQLDDNIALEPGFRDNLKLLSGTGKTFDLCIRQDQLRAHAVLLDDSPETTFILDHCGNPANPAGTFDDWAQAISELAKRPNCIGKISGIIAYDGNNWSTDSLRPYVEHMISAFGWDRVVWGSDHPVCRLTATLTDWVHITRELLKGTSADEQAKLLHSNARRVYGIKA